MRISFISNWEPPTKIIELWSFFGLANHYRRFIKGYFKIITSLIDLLNKGKVWDWNEQCQKAFDQVKQVMTKEPMLALPDYTKLYEVFLIEFDFSMKYKLGKANAVTNALNWKFVP
ncbi:reverse transcriptase [Gossypium australe]|uniref:Reverse transcriptase n=1 Tax=Gossypium australe TaxID=47621 RepID=A0A5B6VBY6_9ROSI|nr:reverse transcriptase [Gossypium australe]